MRNYSGKSVAIVQCNVRFFTAYSASSIASLVPSSAHEVETFSSTLFIDVA
jgi:hypothetical protein